MKGISKRSYFRFISFLLIITTLLPVLANNLPPIISSFHFWAAIWVISIFAFKTNLLFCKAVFQVLVYGIIAIVFFPKVIWINIDDWTMKSLYFEFYYLFIAISVFWYYNIENDFHGLALLVKYSMVFIFITALMSIYSSFVDPLFARKIVGGSYGIEEKEYFGRLGGGDYSFASALVGLFPILIYYYRNIRRSIFSKRIIILFGLFIFVALIRMQIFANIILACIIIILSITGTRRYQTSILILIVALVIFFMLPSSLYSDLLQNSTMFFSEKSEVYFKLNDMSQFLQSAEPMETSTGERAVRYPILFKAFMQSPLLGVAYKGNFKDLINGGHIYWMYKLTFGGMIIFLIYISIHYFNIIRNFRLFSDEYKFYYLLSISAIIVLGLMKNLAGRTVWFLYFILLPGLYYLPILKSKSIFKTKRKMPILRSFQDIDLKPQSS